MPSVRKNEAASRYDLLLDDGRVAGFADYVVRGDTEVALTHTKVQPQYEGRGLASLLAKTALADIQASGHCVVPECPFMQAYIARKPEWQPLLCPV
ncbi:N-acetyltransferase [Corticibacter populi]|uniref:N-acetyltransferase n=1 Tax=Corticibacter populi TaxID=1550736 RepID=A0A3M6QSK2_9BURK|nr:GNAT family N-acetyltransferase [Corticibacter populi]RMX05998.1 N-acetyltransferase [Corticibacter populi]RZS30671.1 hypothetical protein EV687_2858 [Corticibacter populi]